MDISDYIEKNYKIFIDTCSLLDNPIAINKIFFGVSSRLKNNNIKINIPLTVISEVEKHCQNTKNLSLRSKAKRAYRLLGEWQRQGIIEICGNKNENDIFADCDFLSAFTRLRIQSKLLLITQDKKLAADIIKLNAHKSIRGKDVDVLRLNKRGELERFGKKIDTWHQFEGDDDEVKAEEQFAICSQVTSDPDTPIILSAIPAAYDKVYGKNREEVHLGKLLASGGEGCIYAVDSENVAKIYKSGKITQRKKNKLELMFSKNLHYPGICFPKELLYNSKGDFVGYLMPKADGVELRKSVFLKPLFLKRFPNWKKIDLVRLSLNILHKFKYLHARNILVGDINPGNILVVNSQEVYIVDTDSFQVEDYPCPVGTNLFVAKEIQGIHFEGRLRTKGNENFALATLLFMLMMNGKPPYSHQGGESILENIRLQKFPYPLSYRKGEHIPSGQWRFIWSHLSYQLKEAFFETFQAGGKYSAENTRLSVDQWIKIFNDYESNLANGKMGKTDKMSEDVFPSRFKKKEYGRYGICEICGCEVEKKLGAKFNLCYECSKRIVATQTCVGCGQEFTVTEGEKRYRETTGDGVKVIPDLCEKCRKKKKLNNLSAKYRSRFRF